MSKMTSGTSVQTLIDRIRRDQKNERLVEIRRDTIRILHLDVSAASGSYEYRRINPGKAYGGKSFIAARHMSDIRNHYYLAPDKYSVLTKKEVREKNAGSLYFKYRNVFIAPDLSSAAGRCCLSGLKSLVGNFRPDAKSELDVLYLASLLEDMDKDMIFAFVSEEGKDGQWIRRPFGAYCAPGWADEIEEEESGTTAVDMGPVWEAVREDAVRIYGEKAADVFFNGTGSPTKTNAMQKGLVSLMAVCSTELSPLYEVSVDKDGVHDFFIVSPMTYSDMVSFSVFDRGARPVVLTKRLREACGLDDDLLFSEGFLISGADGDGNTCLIAPEPALIGSLCYLEPDSFGKLGRGGDLLLRDILLGRIFNGDGTESVYFTCSSSHEMELGGNGFRIIVSGEGKKERPSADYSKICSMICREALLHHMQLKSWTRDKEMAYLVKFEVSDAVTGEPARIPAPESFMGKVSPTCGMEFAFTVHGRRSLELRAVFYFGESSVLCGKTFEDGTGRNSVCRVSEKKAADVAGALIEGFFGTKGEQQDSSYAYLLRNAGFAAMAASRSNVLTSLMENGSRDHREDIETLIGIKNGTYTGAGRDRIVYVIGRKRIEEKLKAFTSAEIAGWSAYDYLLFIAGFADAGTKTRARSGIMSFTGQLLYESESNLEGTEK